MNNLFRIGKYLEYQYRAKTKYYLHPPFVYQFYLNVLEGGNDDNIRLIHLLRQKLKRESTVLQLDDYGTGNFSSIKVSDLENRVAISEKYGKLLFRLVRYFKPENILELGTSIGISSTYMALANPDAKIISLEGSAELLQSAKQNHSLLGIKNIELIPGNFSETLSFILKNYPFPNFVFFDGNHRKDATLKYFQQCAKYSNENSIFIFDDIYWSEGMSEAWYEIKKHPQITLTIDVFQFGICFFRKVKLAKENFVLRY